MKYVILLCLIFSSTQFLIGQCDTLRYNAPLFNQVFVHQDVKYGEAQVWSIPYNDTELFMDIYEPIGDTLSKRPLMIWIHSGGFLNGNKQHDDMVALCDSFARRGYVTASISYRLGFNPLSSTSAERAVYRGTQDTRAAIRYLKEFHQIYNIDTNYTFLGGSSAGGFATLHTAYLDQNEAPNSIQGSFGVPDLGCLDCDGNNYQHNMDLTGIVNLWGAIGDSSWINSDETVPALLVHGTDDGVVPFGVGNPFGVFTTPVTHGSRSVGNQLDAFGIDNTKWYFPGEDHEPHGTDNGTWNNPPTPYWDTIFNAINKHYFDILRPTAPLISGPMEICEGDTVIFTAGNTDYDGCWNLNSGTILNADEDEIEIVWNNNGTYELEYISYSDIYAASPRTDSSITVHPLPTAAFNSNVAVNVVDFTPNDLTNTSYNWDFGDGNTSTDVTPQHTYAANGSYTVTLTVTNANGCTQQFTDNIDIKTLTTNSLVNSGINIYPNPTDKLLRIESQQNIRSISIYSTDGKQVQRTSSNSQSMNIQTALLENGIYLIEVNTASGSSRHRVVVRH